MCVLSKLMSLNCNHTFHIWVLCLQQKEFSLVYIKLDCIVRYTVCTLNSEQCTFGSVQCVYSEQCTFWSGWLAVEPREKPCFLKSNLFPHLPLLALGLARSIFTKYSLDFSHFTRSHICLNSILRIQHARKLCKRFSVITELNRLYML